MWPGAASLLFCIIIAGRADSPEQAGHAEPAPPASVAPTAITDDPNPITLSPEDEEIIENLQFYRLLEMLRDIGLFAELP